VNPSHQPRDGGASRRPTREPDLWWVLGITLFAAALRLYNIGAASLWTDEAGSLWMATKPSWSVVWHWVAVLENKPPLYYWLLHSWLAAGDSEARLRLMSALFGTLAVAIVYVIGGVIGKREVAITAAILFAGSPINVHYSQETRMYSLLALAAAVSILGQAWLLGSPRPAGMAIETTSCARTSTACCGRLSNPDAVRAAAPWLAYILGTAAALWVHYPAIFLPVAANFVMLMSARELTGRSHFIRNWIGAQLAVVALCSPLIPLYIQQSSGPNLAPLPAVNLWTVLDALLPDMNSSAGAALFLGLRALGLELAVVAVGVAIWAWRDNRRWLTFTLGLWLIPVSGEIIVSLVWRPVLATRTLIWTTIPFYLMVATSITQLRRRPVYRAGMMILLALIMAYGLSLQYWQKPEYEAWRPVVQHIARRVRPGDVILFNDSYVQLPFDYYFERYHISVVEHGIPGDFGAAFIQEHLMTNGDVPELRSFVANHARIWLVYSHNWYTDPFGLVPRNLGQVARLTDYTAFASREPIAVFLYERRP
jgi:mannosyltransferase